MKCTVHTLLIYCILHYLFYTSTLSIIEGLYLVADEAPNVDEVIRQANIEIQAENRNLQALNTSLHKKYHSISLKVDFLCKEG